MNEKWLSRKIRAECKPWFWYSFECAAIWSVPDLYAVAPAMMPFWVELKIVKTCECLIPFRRGQPQWLNNHTRQGGRAYVLVGVQQTNSIVLLPVHDNADLVARMRISDLSVTSRQLFEVDLASVNPWEALSSKF